MRPMMIVLTSVILDEHTGFGEGPKLLTIEAFVPEASMEALHIAVLIRLTPHPSGVILRMIYVAAAPLPRTAWINVDRLDLILFKPCLNSVGDELPRFARPSGCLRQAIYAMLRFTTIVTSEVFWCSMLCDGFSHPLQNIFTLECPISTEHMALSGIFIKDSQHPNGSSSGRGITDEVLVSCYMALVLGLYRQSRGVASTHHLSLGGRNSKPKGSP